MVYRETSEGKDLDLCYAVSLMCFLKTEVKFT